MRILLQILISTAIGCVMAGELPEEMREMAQQLHDGCLEETGVDPGLLPPCMQGNFADDPKLKCYFKCYFSQIGALSDDGVLDAEAFASILPPEMQNLLPPIKACSSVTGTDACDVAFHFNKCLQKADPAAFIII
uniref:Odorant binding protein 6 n=1 Tax=Pachypeltis micranthus TaxID=1983339 RepID=A0A1W6QYA6_9HEMI|nr:odorant binding protein 6 [Pachypeltis micranthus]